MPYPRIQSVAITQGPLARALRLGNLEVHTVMGPIAANLGALDRAHIVALFRGVGERAISGADRDTSHRWGTQASTGAATTSTETEASAAAETAHPEARA